MTQARLEQTTFKDNMKTLQVFLDNIMLTLQQNLARALDHSTVVNFFDEHEHPAKLCYLALTWHLQRNRELILQHKIKNDDIIWDLETCLLSYLKEQNDNQKQGKITALRHASDRFDFEKYYEHLSADKQQFFQSLISLYQAWLSLYEHSTWDIKDNIDFVSGADFNIVCNQLNETLKQIGHLHIVEPPVSILFDAALIETKKNALDIEWQAVLDKAQNILTAWLEEEREIHRYVMSVGTLVNVNAQQRNDYCKEIETLEKILQEEVKKLSENKTALLTDLQQLIRLTIDKPFYITGIAEQDWQKFIARDPYFLALSQQQKNCHSLENQLLDAETHYRLLYSVYMVQLGQSSASFVSAWIDDNAKKMATLSNTAKACQKICAKQTSTGNELWTHHLTPIFVELEQWLIAQQSEPIVTTEVHALRKYSEQYCDQTKIDCITQNMQLEKNLTEAGVLLSEMNVAIHKMETQYYETANEYERDVWTSYWHVKMLAVLKELGEIREQLHTKSIPSISDIFRKAKKEYADVWKSRSTAASGYLGTSWRAAYQVGSYAVAPVFYTGAAFSNAMRFFVNPATGSATKENDTVAEEKAFSYERKY